jgi:hypothetical protein
LPAAEPPPHRRSHRKEPKRGRLSAISAASAALAVIGLVVGSCGGAGGTTDTGGPQASGGGSAIQATGPAAPPQVYQGNGASVVKLGAGPGPRLVSFAYDGSTAFVVASLDAAGAQLELMVNATGSYHGTAIIDAPQTETATSLKIEAGAAWTITVKPASMATVWNGSGPYRGRGDDVVALAPGTFGDLESAHFTYTGTGLFLVYAVGTTKAPLVNEFGGFSGDAVIPRGATLLGISGNATWTITKVQ